jgi:hypothetical protein
MRRDLASRLLFVLDYLARQGRALPSRRQLGRILGSDQLTAPLRRLELRGALVCRRESDGRRGYHRIELADGQVLRERRR